MREGVPAAAARRLNHFILHNNLITLLPER